MSPTVAVADVGMQGYVTSEKHKGGLTDGGQSLRRRPDSVTSEPAFKI